MTAACDRDGIAGTAGVALPPSGPGIYAAGAEGGGDGDDADSEGDGALTAFHAALNPITFTTTLDPGRVHPGGRLLDLRRMRVRARRP